MRPREHVILGSAVSIGLYLLLGREAIYNVIYFWVASILIDLDHYIDYIYNNKFTDFSFKRMLEYHTFLFKNRFNPAFINLSIFHTVESMFALGAVALYTGSAPIIFVWWAFLFHIICDTINLIIDGSTSIRSNSIIGYFFRVKKLRLKGLDTKAVYTGAVNEVKQSYGN
ncbi:MAG: hypothetical protein V3V95_01355 [Thermodesulfobacteriota bacterium]